MVAGEGAAGAPVLPVSDDRRLPGEEPLSATVDDAVHWLLVYHELLTFFTGVLSLAPRHMALPRETSDSCELARQRSQRCRQRIAEWQSRLDVARRGDDPQHRATRALAPE